MKESYTKEELKVLIESLIDDLEKEELDFIEEYGISGLSMSKRQGYYRAFNDLLELLA